MSTIWVNNYLWHSLESCPILLCQSGLVMAGWWPAVVHHVLASVLPCISHCICKRIHQKVTPGCISTTDQQEYQPQGRVRKPCIPRFTCEHVLTELCEAPKGKLSSCRANENDGASGSVWRHILVPGHSPNFPYSEGRASPEAAIPLSKLCRWKSSVEGH